MLHAFMILLKQTGSNIGLVFILDLAYTVPNKHLSCRNAKQPGLSRVKTLILKSLLVAVLETRRLVAVFEKKICNFFSKLC